MSEEKRVVKRFNVLYLLTMAYVVLLILFCVLACKNSAIEAWDLLEAPFMALIGGTLAISKDLISGDALLSEEDPQNLQNKPSNSGK